MFSCRDRSSSFLLWFGGVVFCYWVDSGVVSYFAFLVGWVCSGSVW